MVKLIKGINDLATLRPDLALQWHPTKNGIFTPEMFTIGSEKKMWWLCPKGHEWEAIIANRSNCGSGCPVCVGKQVLIGYNDLPTTNPELALQWHPTKNGDKTPEMFSKGSGEKAWWICPLGHEWEAQISSRSQGNGCPICYGRQTLAGYNDLTTTHPQLAKQWHPTKNGTLTPEMFTKGSHQKAWWVCPKGHAWQTTIHERLESGGCPICSGHQVLAGFNDLATVNPQLASEWHPTKNGNKTPDMFTKYSNEKMWWICPKGHEWQATITNRSSGSGCPVCYSESQTSFPEQAIYYYLKQIDDTVENRKKINNKWEVDIWIPSKNTAIEYDGIYYHVGKQNEKREAKKNIYLQKQGIKLIRVKEPSDKNINVCVKNNLITFSIKNNYFQLSDVIKELIVLVFDDVQHDIAINRDRNSILELFKQECLKNSLATLRPDLALEWHPTKNGTLTPDMFTQWSNEKAWWICPLGHEWEARIANRSKCGSGCPICSGHSVLKGVTDLLTTNPELAKEWHPSKNGTLTPQNVTQYSGKKVWWICPKGHVWQATIANRSKGSGCPICYGRQVLSGYNDLATINTQLAKQWHPTKNGTLKPTDVTQHSGIKVWWICPLGHEWEAKICNRSIGRGCPICAGKQVLIGYNDLLTTTPQLASEWHPTKNGNLKPTDVTQHSGKTAWWICPKGHVWQATVNTRSKGMGCPVCAGNRVVSGYNDLLTTNPELASQWHPTKNGDRTPRMFTNRSKKKASWICPKGHEWEATISNRSKDASCPICKQLN